MIRTDPATLSVAELDLLFDRPTATPDYRRMAAEHGLAAFRALPARPLLSAEHARADRLLRRAAAAEETDPE